MFIQFSYALSSLQTVRGTTTKFWEILHSNFQCKNKTKDKKYRQLTQQSQLSRKNVSFYELVSKI